MIQTIRSVLLRRLATLVTIGFRWLAPIMIRSFDLVNYSQVARATDYLSHDYRDVLSRLASDSIIFLDIGAGGKSEPLVEKYYEEFERIYVEPRTKDFPNTSSKGAVIDKAISDKLGTSKFYRTNLDELSSLLQPTGQFAEYYASGDWNTITNITEIGTTTVDHALAELSAVKLDYLKIDTQGTELDVLRGLGKYNPLFVSCEIFFVPFYRDSCLIWDIGKYLSERGYAMFDLAYRSSHIRREADYHKTPVGRLLTGGRAWFMPNWKSVSGKELIFDRDLEWGKLMIMFGMWDMLKSIVVELSTPNKDKLLSALEYLQSQ